MSKKNINTKKNKEVLTIEDILKRKEYFEKKRKETTKLYVKSIDSYIEICKVDKELYLEIMDMEEDESDEHLVYNAVINPNLKSEELQKAFGVNNPYDILTEIFDYGEIKQISAKVLEFSGYLNSVELDSKKIVGEIKN